MTRIRMGGVSAWCLILGLGAALNVPVTAAQLKVEAQAKTTNKPAAQEEPISEQEARELDYVNNPRAVPQPSPLVEKDLSAEEKALFKRVEARWAALVAFDLKKVYSFATPEYRKAHDQLHLNNQYGNKVARTGADIVGIKFIDEQKTQAKVKSKLKFQTVLPGVNQLYDGYSWETDTWVKVDGQWWYVEPR